MREVGGDAARDARHVLPAASTTQLRLERALRGHVLCHHLETLAVAVRTLDRAAVEAQHDRLAIAIQPAGIDRFAPLATPPRHGIVPVRGVHHHAEAGACGEYG